MLRARFALLAAALSAPLVGCSSEDASATGTPDAATDTAPSNDAGDASDASDTTPDQAAGTPGWHLTTYFTALDSFFSGAQQALTGCLTADCTAPGDPTNALGDYAADFAAAVQTEGTGQITAGPHSGEYLNWSGSQPGSGYWLDTAPRDAQGGALLAYVSAAASDGYAFGQSFAVLDCGVDSTTQAPMDPQACASFQQASWQIRDRFESNTEPKHLDLYIGLQTALDMDNDPHFVDQIQAVTTLP